MWKKNISLKDARKLSKMFCNDFAIDYCQIYFVDVLRGNLGEYCHVVPPHILMRDIRGINKIGILMHELTHHLETYIYGYSEKFHGYEYQLAKERVVSWCRNNISTKPNWYLPLKSCQKIDEMKAFKI